MQDPQIETLQRITRVETKIDNIEEKLDSAIDVRDMAISAAQSAKSAHHRLDRIEEGQKWLWRTVSASAITVVIGAIVAVIKTGGM
ncbi:hemolysin XhlA family protein [Paenibacillus farraposensis]|uniref:Hemolysin XhlA family protein n=1 Tax=Paenibacillus farraposensis TaxID=2807095 RepID=A0ABW4DC19_9BACL|nr:hemolysin XhlA family protein [Paenibacillus farraposensis]MCC3379888.1 hemolysin XhlA family protein [Paenibacillus farraposensis]